MYFMNRAQKELYDNVMQTCRREGIQIFLGRELTPLELRKRWIDFYENYKPQQHVLCPSCCSGEVGQLERDRKYNLFAYQQMTGREILMSEQREMDLQSQETTDFLRYLRAFEKHSRKSNIRICFDAQKRVA